MFTTHVVFTYAVHTDSPNEAAAMSNRSKKLREQCQRQVANLDGVNYARARAAYEHEVTDAIIQALHHEGHDRAYITRRAHERLVEW